MAITAAATQCEEGIARLNAPRIDRHRPDRLGSWLAVELACQQAGQRAGIGKGHRSWRLASCPAAKGGRAGHRWDGQLSLTFKDLREVAWATFSC